MKSFTLIFSLITLFICACKTKEPTNAELASKFLELLKSGANKNNLDSTSSIPVSIKYQVFEESRKQLYFREGGPLDETTFANMKYTNPDTDATKWVFYYKNDIETVLATLPKDCSNCGIRMYLKNHDSNMVTSQSKPHPYAGRATVVLRAAENGIDITKNASALYDYGDVCPPNCNVNCDFEFRAPQDYKDGICCDKKRDPTAVCK